ncbi:MAG: Rieske 2Fe-2S domain-containing protein [Acidobacteria bacterium]|nr:Rieske 2Fe-2S domain-containing protein [Acidobacteriota bacterium]MCW5948679.1 Rieske 2Fe-2S domain-containing protein [Pyrinomonadaceae bacterium]
MFSIDADIRKARTLPSEFYLDAAYFTAVRERIFLPSWHLVGHSDSIADLEPVTLLPGMLDDPLLIVKTREWISCLSNVCTHRAMLLVEEPCRGDLIRCRYHGRRFALDGRMLSMPEFEGVEDFPAESDHLAKLPFAEMGGFLFASAAPGFDHAEITREAGVYFDADTTAGLKLTSKREYRTNAHWALYCENYLEGFHIPYVHHGLNGIVDYGSYTTETFRYSSVQTGLDGDGRVAARYLFIFPNLMFNFYPWGISVNIVRPIAPDETMIEFQTYVRDETLLEEGAGADLHTVELEDEAVVESVQRGIRSRFYDRGRYSPSREQGTHHFHRLIAEFLHD